MIEPIRVLQVIGIMNRGGAETMIMNLYRQIDRTKVQFDFVENENSGADYDNEIRSLGGMIYHCPRFTGKNYVSYKRWWRDFFDMHKEHRIIHGHIGSSAAIYLEEAKKHGIMTIAHSHNTDAKNSRQIVYNMFSFPTRYIADNLFMCSMQAGIDRYGDKAVRQKGYLVPNAIKTEQFRFSEETRKDKRKELGIPSDAFLVGHVGRFAEQKNHAFLLDVFTRIVSFCPSVKMLLIGDGDLRSEIEKKIVSLSLQDKVILTGVRSDIDRMLMAIDVMVFPSKYEGLPVTLVEAQCSGLPCVISENIPKDSVLIDELVEVCSLNESPDKWAKAALKAKHPNRVDCADRIKKCGYDIVESAKWLEEFYLEKSK